jgi:hypothetical protein
LYFFECNKIVAVKSKGGVTMSKAGAKFSEVKEILMKDELFKEEYERLKLCQELLTVEQDCPTGCTGSKQEELGK